MANFESGQHYDEKYIVANLGPNVQSLNIEDNFLLPDHIAKLCQSIKSLEKLNVSKNSVMLAIKDVGELVQRSDGFDSLIAHETRLGNRGARILAEYISHHPTLNYVNVNSNGIGDAAAMDLMIALGTCPSMKDLHIWDNPLTPDRLREVHKVLGLQYTLHV